MLRFLEVTLTNLKIGKVFFTLAIQISNFQIQTTGK